MSHHPGIYTMFFVPPSFCGVHVILSYRYPASAMPVSELQHAVCPTRA